jgi:ubiquitin carboxyl-terminal hydrolase 10
MPIIPVVPKTVSRGSPSVVLPDASHPREEVSESVADGAGVATSSSEIASVDQPSTDDLNSSGPVATGPKSWANLFKGPVSTAASSTNGSQVNTAPNVSGGSFSKSNNESLSDALYSFNASAKDLKLSFLEPRGLVNTGNMCYMNSVSSWGKY